MDYDEFMDIYETIAELRQESEKAAKSAASKARG